MPEFKDSQTKYLQSKDAYRQAEKESYLARQQYLLIEKKIEAFLKAQLLKSLPAAHELNTQRKAAVKKLALAEKASASAKKTLDTARLAFNNQGTVNQTITNLNDNTPILLLPLRLQTRFLTIKHIARNWPVEIMTDAGKLDPASKEIIRSINPHIRPGEDAPIIKGSQAFSLSNDTSAKAKRLASNLNEGTGSRRAMQIKRWLKVEDEYELWVRIFPDDLFLQTHESALTETELVAAKAFWQTMWDAEREFRLHSADSDPAGATKNEKQLEAWKALRFECLAHRANWIARAMRPAGYPDNLPADMDKIPADKFPDPGVKSDSWTIPPATEMLPEHFIIKIFFQNTALPGREIVGAPVPDYVQLGFNPDEQDEKAFAEKGKVLELPQAIRWLTDLAEAEKAGMAVRIILSRDEFLSGISKMVVVGIKTGADEMEGSRLLTNLINNHHYRPDGMAFLPQGTPTNNLPGHPSGFSQAGVSDEESFNNEFPAMPDNDPNTDGHKLSTALGLDQHAFTNIFNNGRHDGEQALTMNRALWPGTLGYYLDNHLRPSITDTDIGFVKTFFQNFVTGRGLLPSFRVGKQPYGIIPSTVWSAWEPEASAGPEEKRLVKLLKKMDNQWATLVEKVMTMKRAFENTNEEQLKKDFRELLTYQASSTRYFRRLVAGEYLLWNVNHMTIPLNTEKAGIKTTPNEYKTRLESAGAWNEAVNPRPQILGKFFDDDNYKLTDLPPASSAGLNRINENGANYLFILLDATLEQMKANSFGDNFGKFVTEHSSRLLFYTARFALLQGWVKAATALLQKDNPVISPFARLDFEMEYILSGNSLSNEHSTLLASSGINGNFETRKNKWNYFEQTLKDGSRIDSRIAQRLKENLTADDPVKELQESTKALAELSAIPVENLERLFSEHVDLCSFRLDAWLQALVLSRLSSNRQKEGFEKGIFLGSFGYLENISPGDDPWVQVKEIKTPQVVTMQEAGPDKVAMPVMNLSGLTSAQLEAARKSVFVYLGSEPATTLIEDPDTKKIVQNPVPNQVTGSGYVLTPSLEHAATAGILRAGYEHHGRSQGPESKTLSVNIDSARTGRAVDMLKAVKAGHSLNEQLGYNIERKMYDNPALAQFIPALRLAFPLHIERNEWDDDQGIEEKEKINNLAMVTDGLAILTKKQSPTVTPTWDNKLTEIFSSQQAAKNAFAAIVDEAAEQFDAVSDIVLAESVFQTVKGSPERAAAALRMVGEGSDIMLPEVVNIPVENRVVTHRVGFILNTDLNQGNVWPEATAPTSIFARLSPALNRWLADQFPAPARIFARVLKTDNSKLKVGLVSTGIQPIDLFYLLQKTGQHPEESLLSWLFTEEAKKIHGTDPKTITGVSFDRDDSFKANDLSVREMLPLVKAIGAMLAQSRPMRPEDFLLMQNSTGNPVSDLYDNSSIKAVCGEFCDNSPNGPVNLFLKKLTTAKESLEKNLPVGFGSAESDLAFSNLIRLIPQSFYVGIWDAVPRCPDICTRDSANVLLDQATNIMEQLAKRVAVANAAFSQITSQPPEAGTDKLFDMLSRLSKQLGGEDFLVLPSFHLPDPASINASYNDPALKSSIGEFGLEEWIQGLSMVRANIRGYQSVNNLRTVFNAPARNRNLKILQLPFVPGFASHWAGAEFPEGFQLPPQVTSMAYEFSAPFNATQIVCGVMIDDWREKIPLPELTAGISIKYDQSNAEAPQCLLLLVAPELKGAWDWQSVVNSVMETMELAKKRAVDGELIQTTWLSQFLPAFVTPLDANNNTPNLDFRWAGPALRPIITGGHGPVIDTGGGVFERT